MKKTGKNRARRGILLPLLLFALAVSALLLAVRSADLNSDRKRMETLEKAVHRVIMHCYALEGRYPPSAEYMQERYALRVEDDFYISYVPTGVNTYPSVAVRSYHIID